MSVKLDQHPIIKILGHFLTRSSSTYQILLLNARPCLRKQNWYCVEASPICKQSHEFSTNILIPALQASTCKGLLPQSAANFLTLLKSARSSWQISITSLFLIDFLAFSAFSIDLHAMTIFHSFVAASAFTAARPIPRFAPVTMTVFLFRLLGAAAEMSTDRHASCSRISKQNTTWFVIYWSDRWPFSVLSDTKRKQHSASNCFCTWRMRKWAE